MAGFLYFLEGCGPGQVADVLPLRGLAHLSSERMRVRGVSCGPGKADGVVIADRDQVDAGQVGYWPDKQAWFRVPKASAWCGFFTDAKPGPADLVRARLVPGEDVELGDGNLWHVPHAIDYGGPGLPRVMQLDDEGHWVPGDIVAEYRTLWDLAWEWRDAIDQLCAWGDEHERDGQPTFDGYADPRLEFNWIFSRSVQVLQTNYAIGPTEASSLGLFVTGRQWAILQALCDSQGLQKIMEGAVAEDQKKTDASPDTAVGSAAD